MKNADEKALRNHDGDKPSDIPSGKLINGPDKHSGKPVRESGKNSTGKDPKLGARHTTR